jgi:uncharacterized protein (TIGR03086 family)
MTQLGGIALLERAIDYTLGSLRLATPAALSRSTPCAGWNLRVLLGHISDSLVALHQAMGDGRVGLDESTMVSEPVLDPIALVRDRACELLETWATAEGRELISIAGCPLTTTVVTSTGAVEIAVHGWDIAGACGQRRAIPTALAEEMLELAPLLVTGVDRPARFAAPVEIPRQASPGDRLVAFLGRHPD